LAKFRTNEIDVLFHFAEIRQIFSLDLGHAAGSFSKDMQTFERHASWTFSIDMGMRIYSQEMYQEHAACTYWMDMQHGEAEGCSLKMQHCHSPWTCSKPQQQ
jgi:hypothetical protein